MINLNISSFYNQNIFSRLILYIFVSELAVKFVFELLMGQWWFELSQPKQYIFFILLGIDYVINLPKIFNLRVQSNFIAVWCLVLIFMIVQGVWLGLAYANPVFLVFNDTVPLIVIVLNVLLMNNINASQTKVDFGAIFQVCSVVALLVVIIGFVAVSIGLPSKASLGGQPISLYIAMFFAALITGHKIKPFYLLCFISVLIFSLENMNRTTLAFFLICSLIYVLFAVYKDIYKGVLILFLSIGILAGFWIVLPKDSPTYNRIIGITELDFSKRTGSVGERQAEFESINKMLTSVGPVAQFFGAGHGGTYEVRFTHKYNKDYGHAHYSWALFTLRYGYTGWFYLLALGGALVYNMVGAWNKKEATSLFVSLICLQSILYLGTYVNFVILLSGIQFFNASSIQYKET